MLVDVADGTTTADDDVLVVVAAALLAAEVVGAELPAIEDEDDSEDTAVAVARIVVLSDVVRWRMLDFEFYLWIVAQRGAMFEAGFEFCKCLGGDGREDVGQ